MHQTWFQLGFCTRPHSRSSQLSLDLLAGIQRSYFYVEGGEEKRGKKTKKEREEMHGRKRKGRKKREEPESKAPNSHFWCNPLLQNKEISNINKISNKKLTYIRTRQTMTIHQKTRKHLIQVSFSITKYNTATVIKSWAAGCHIQHSSRIRNLRF